MKMMRLSFVWACACSIGLCFGDEDRTVTLAPEADAYLQRGDPYSTTCYGKVDWLSAGEARESIIRFDVSGVSDISSARIRLHCNQHAAGDETFVVFRTVRDFDWDESSVTRANMAHAIPYLSTRSAWIAASDPDYAGIATVTANGEWSEADVTEAVRKAARTNGKVTFHMFSPCGDRNWLGIASPDCFDSREAKDAAVRPQLVVTCTGTGAARTWTDYDVTERHFAASDAVWMDNGSVKSGSAATELLANPSRRSFLLKFNTGAYSAGSVGRAILRLVGSGASNATSTNWDLLIEDAGDWDGATIQSDGLHSEILSRTRIPSVLPENGLNFTSFSHAKYVTNELDVTELVRQGSKFASGCLTFQALSGGDYIICGGKTHSDAALHPELEIRFQEATMSVERDEAGVKVSWKAVGGAQAYHVERAVDPDGDWTRVVSGVTGTSAYDGRYPGAFAWWYRVVTVDADGNEIAGRPLFFNEKPVWETREALQNGRPFSRTPDSPAYTGAQMQCGDPGNDVALAYLMFDPTGLDDIPTARFRFRGRDGDHSGEMRILGAVTDAWDPAFVTWKRGVEGFTHLNPVPDSDMEHELARIGYDLSPSNQAPYCEVEVAELVREAARQKRYLTILMTGSHGDAWQYFNTQDQGVGADNRPMLVYPAVTGFGRLAVTGDFTGEMPTAELAWTPGPVGTTYCVSREVQRVEDERVLADGLTEPSFIDGDARRETSVYRVTATFPDGMTASETVTNSLFVAADLPCVADTWVYLGTPDAAYGTSDYILLKDGGGGTTTREGLMRFDLSAVPSGTSRVYLQLRMQTMAGFTGEETLYVRGIPDESEWTDATAPSWNKVFPDRQRAADPASEGFCGRIAASELSDGEPFKLDVTAAVLEAIAAGRTTCTLHLYLDDPDRSANCTFYSRETSAMSGDRAKLLCVKRNWRGPGAVIILR